LSVLKGEGKVPILFGTSSMPARTKTHRGYISRPDLGGEWPTVLIVPDDLSVTSSVKDICRRLARQGLASVAPDLSSTSRVRADFDDIVDFVGNPAGFWSSAERGYGIFGIGSGASLAIQASREVGVLAFALAYPDGPLDGLQAIAAPMLGLLTRSEGSEDVVGLVRSAAPHAELVVYDDVQPGFLDDSSDAFDQPAFTDGLERLSTFFEKHLALAR
jgi:dienelactone hydrolase